MFLVSNGCILRTSNFKTYLALFSPLLLSQLMQRAFAVIDSRFLTHLEPLALEIHSLQAYLMLAGQFFGFATLTSLLFFWKRAGFESKKDEMFWSHLILGVSFTFVVGALLIAGLPLYASFYFPPESYELVRNYLLVGLTNMVLQTAFTTVDGLLIASGRAGISIITSACLLAINYAGDYFVIHTARFEFNLGLNETLVSFALVTTLAKILSIFACFYLLNGLVITRFAINIKCYAKNWLHEVTFFSCRTIASILASFFMRNRLQGPRFLWRQTLPFRWPMYFACLLL